MVARGPNPRHVPRGPAAMRRGGPKADRDGDLTMGAAIKSQGRIGKSAPVNGPNRGASSRTSRPGGLRDGVLSDRAKSLIVKHAAAGDVSMKETRTMGPRGGLVELKVTGWEKSKASSDADGGVSSLIKWMEKKASNRLGSRSKPVKVKKSRTEGTSLIISVPPEDIAALVRMNGYGWAGTTVHIEKLGGAVEDAQSKATQDVKDMLRTVLERRYNFETKLLDLSALSADTELQKSNIFDKKSTTSKAFPALMKVLELSFDAEEERHAAISSVSLANNELADLTTVISLSQTLYKLQALDLSNNKLDLSAVQNSRRRFRHLQHLIISGNPLESGGSDYRPGLVNSFPELRTLNGIQVRTEEEIANRTKVPDLPFPIRTALFQDDGGIAEGFVRTFFTGFDSDRASLAALYYDDLSDFSFAVNTQAPRDPCGSEHTEKQEWDHYIKQSRNLKKISHLPARQHRLFKGTRAVANAFGALPKTRHPDLATEARKWMIEAHIQSGVPDPSGQSPNGVDGFLITVHGEFDELDGVSGQPNKKRSFDRTFVIGPGGPSGVRVVNDLLTIRAYGGAKAFETETMEGWIEVAAAPSTYNLDAPPQLPAGLTVEVAEQMVTELQKQTRMTIQYAKDCLDQVGWDFPKALEAFANVKGNLPPDAFVQAT